MRGPGKLQASTSFGDEKEFYTMARRSVEHVSFGPGNKREPVQNKSRFHDERPMSSSTVRRSDDEQDKNDDLKEPVIGFTISRE
jgi:hypothetical protein